MGPIGVQEMIAIFVIALVLFGPKKLPELGRMLGKALSEFRRAKSELKATFETHLQELEREARLNDSNSIAKTPDYSSPRYPHTYDEYGRNYYDSGYTEPEPAAPAAPPAIAPPAEPVAGTIPRSNGSQPAEPVPAATEQDHPV